jgi:hypothetical protein
MNISDTPNDALNVNLRFPGTKNLFRKCGHVIASLVSKH